MATMKYFSGEIQLNDIHGMDNVKFAAAFPDVKGFRYDSFQRLVGFIPGTKTLAAVERKIEYKSNPSKHVCNAKCMNASSHGVCECSCGGKNHGYGGFRCE